MEIVIKVAAENLLEAVNMGNWGGGVVATAQKVLSKIELEELIFDGQSPTKKATTELLENLEGFNEPPIKQADLGNYICTGLLADLRWGYGIEI